MGWKIVEIENGSYLKLFLNNLVVLRENDKITIPINDIDVLLISNNRINISIQLLNELSKYNILTIICDNKYKPTTYVLPIIGNYNSLKVFHSQLEWNHYFKSNLWKNIVKQKIINQSELINFVIKNKQRAKQIFDFSKEIKEYDITNREGHASKIYWNSLFGKDFSRQNECYENSLLNYGYSILNGYISRSIIKKGLDPRISLFHKSFHNHFALSSDLIEPFRILIDYQVIKILKNTTKNFYEDKALLINIFNKKVIINEKKHFLNNAIDLFIDCIVKQGDFPKLIFLNKELIDENGA